MTMANFGAPQRRIVDFEAQWALARGSASAVPAGADDPPF
jgi:hypothetical protein